MWRVILMSIILLHLPFFAFQANGATALKINYATVDVDYETLSLYGINFTSCGPLDVWIGDNCITDNCYIESTLIDCGLTGTPALSGGTWSVRISAGNAPHCNEEIDVFIPTGLAECNTGDFVECYSGDPATKGVGPCKSGIRTCIEGVWSPCEGEIIPQQEDCEDTIDNDCDSDTDCADSDCVGNPACAPTCVDNDEDGYGVCPDCGTEKGCPFNGDDCDDGDPNINPGKAEKCDGKDNNCNNLIDQAEVPVSVMCPNVAHATEDCAGASGCVIADCDPDWYDLDGVYDNGCEHFSLSPPP